MGGALGWESVVELSRPSQGDAPLYQAQQLGRRCMTCTPGAGAVKRRQSWLTFLIGAIAAVGSVEPELELLRQHFCPEITFLWDTAPQDRTASLASRSPSKA